MGFKHFIYSNQSAIGTWVTPARAVPVESFDIQHARESLNLNVTGAGRAPYLTVLGAKPVTATLVIPWWTINVASLFNCMMTTLDTDSPNAGVYDHDMLFDDTTYPKWFSGQGKYTATLARNLLGAAIDSVKITAATKAAAKLEFGLIAKDEGKAGGTWDFDGSACPAVVASPTYGTLRRPLMFYDATVTIGGTPSLSDGRLTIGSGTTYSKLSQAAITISNNIDSDGFGLTPDPTVQETIPGNRDIELAFDMSWSDYATTFYDNARAGTAMAFDLALVGPTITGVYKYEAHITIPSVFFDPVNLPPIDGDKSKKTISVVGKAQTDTTTGVDFGLSVRTSEATI